MKLNQIYNKDVLELMKTMSDESIDLIVTDPPYKVTARGNAGNSGGMMQDKLSMQGKIFKHNDIKPSEYIPEFYRLLKDGSHCYIMTNHVNLHEMLNVAKESGFQKGLTLERKDVNGNYCPENCTWATKKQQANNRRNTLLIECNGKKHTIGEWSDILGVCQSTISNRYYRGLPIDKVLSKEDLRCQD